MMEWSIIRVSPGNYADNADLMETTRIFRQEHLWPVEYFTSLIRQYRISDADKTTFVAVNSKHEFVGMRSRKGLPLPSLFKSPTFSYVS